ncbi:MAG: DUF692 domain-containing protein [Henriciella sp.]|uniref:MNIO family bufferin maturase n=1 Tax=Henriciella sp. TaxID=1968823 RepID=UPI0032EF7B20
MSVTVNLPRAAGISLKPDHYRAALDDEIPDLWFEVHPENYMVDGGPRLAWLNALREERALSFHGVGASLGGLDPFDKDHLLGLKRLIDRFQPEQVSEHATFSAHDGRYHADLLPLPRTGEAIRHLSSRISDFQHAIGRQILIENPTNYLPFASELDEPDFLVEVARQSGCGLLIDLNNVWVSARNVGLDPSRYIQGIPPGLVGEVHVAGHSEDPELGAAFLIDSHDAPVAADVFDLLEAALRQWGPKPVLVERDGNIPSFEELMAEREAAQVRVRSARKCHAIA